MDGYNVGHRFMPPISYTCECDEIVIRILLKKSTQNQARLQRHLTVACVRHLAELLTCVWGGGGAVGPPVVRSLIELEIRGKTSAACDETKPMAYFFLP